MGYSTGNFTVLGNLLADRKDERLKVVDLGSQDVKVFDPSDLETLLGFVSGRNGDTAALRRAVGTTFPSIIEAREVFTAANLDYVCCDVDQRPGTIYVDYTTHAFDRTNYGKYDVVLNAGTTEHLATPVAALFLMHYLCKQGGVLFNEVPLAGWMNHGLNNMTPKFWHTMRWMNSYDVLSAEAKYAIVSKADDGNFGGAHLDFIENLADSGKVSSSIQIIFRKTQARGFVVPYDAVIPTDDGGEAIWKLVVGSQHPYVVCGSITPQEAVNCANDFLQYQCLPYRRSVYPHRVSGAPVGALSGAANGDASEDRPRASLSAAAVTIARGPVASASEIGSGAIVSMTGQAAAMRGRLARIGQTIGGLVAGRDRDLTKTELEQLQQELEIYRHAFETTTADRDRISLELDQYKYAFETTTVDRDRLASELDSLKQEITNTTQVEDLRGIVQKLESERHDHKQSLTTTIVDRDRYAAWQTHLRAMSDPLDAGYLRLDFARFGNSDTRDEAIELTKRWLAAHEAGNFEAIVHSAVSEVRARIAVPLPKEYCRTLSSYYLASLLTYQGKTEEAQAFLKAIATAAPPDGADFLPYDLTQGTRSVASWQALALERNAPGAVMVSLWKSASAHLTSMISRVFDIPVARVSVGEGLQAVVVTHWLQQIMKGGVVTHEHFFACLNLNQLAESGIEEIFVQVRDPRDVAFSVARMAEDWQARGVEMASPDLSTATARAEQFLYDNKIAADWIADWVYAPQRTRRLKLKVTFIMYDQVVQNLSGTFEQLFGARFDAPARERLQSLLSDSGGRGANFRSATGGEWRKAFPESVRLAAYEAIPQNVRELLSLKP